MSEVFDIQKMLEFLYNKNAGQMQYGFVYSTYKEEGSNKTHEGAIFRAVNPNDSKNSIVSMFLKDFELIGMEGLQVYPIDIEGKSVIYDAKLPYKITVKAKDMMREENGITTTYSGTTEMTLTGPLAAKFMIMYITEKLEFSLEKVFPDGDGSKFVTPEAKDKFAVWYRQMTLANCEPLTGLSFVPCDREGGTAEAGNNYGFRPQVDTTCHLNAMTLSEFETILSDYQNNPNSATRVVRETGITEKVLMDAFLKWRKVSYDSKKLSMDERRKEVEKIPNYICLKIISQQIAKGQPEF